MPTPEPDPHAECRELVQGYKDSEQQLRSLAGDLQKRIAELEAERDAYKRLWKEAQQDHADTLRKVFRATIEQRITELEQQLDKLCDELDATTRYANRLRALVEYAAANSSVTTSDEPGCFYCDYDDDAKHAKNCPAAIVLALPRTNSRRCITEFDWERD